MSTAVETFFSAWGMDDDAARGAAIAGYVNMFCANAPRWSA